MKLDAGNRIRLKREVERILHSPWTRNSSRYLAAGTAVSGQGGITSRNLLEIAVVIDCRMEKEDVQETVMQLAGALKSFGEIFRNVRVNVIWWEEEDQWRQEIQPLAGLQMSRFFDGYEKKEKEKTFDALTGYMRKFQARSKIVFLLIPEGELKICEKAQTRQNLAPMLHRKWLVLQGERPVTNLSQEGTIALPGNSPV